MNQQFINEKLEQIQAYCEKVDSITLMEVCGTHTVSLMRSGVKSMLPENLRLISGPGCPVCVTGQGYIDAACELSLNPNIIICTYGDMVRVPGGDGSLEDCKAKGADVRIVYSARDAVGIAEKNPDKDIVFLSVGFETTTPPSALAIMEVKQKGIENFYIISGHKLVIPAMQALLSSGEVPIDGFVCPGHVSIILGADAYKCIVEDFNKACVVAGFEPEQMIAGIAELAREIAENDIKVENVYGVAVHNEGNKIAQKVIEQVFEPADVIWRAMGVLPMSGLELREEYSCFDAVKKFGIEVGEDRHIPGCRCGDVIQGKLEPRECPLFGVKCTQSEPVGPCMVSSEGTCAAWYKYGNA